MKINELLLDTRPVPGDVQRLLHKNEWTKQPAKLFSFLQTATGIQTRRIFFINFKIPTTTTEKKNPKPIK